MSRALGLRARLAHWALRRLGWTVDGPAPALAKYVLVVAPHTSNWDFPIGYLGKLALGLELRWVGKDALFRWPYGWLMRWLGGIGVDRSSRNNVTAQLAELYRRSERLIIAITPEGTRSYRPAWKSGFYYLALTAEVPVALGYLDYGRRRLGISEPFTLSGDQEADLARIRAFYADKTGLYPEQTADIRFEARPGTDRAATRPGAAGPAASVRFDTRRRADQAELVDP